MLSQFISERIILKCFINEKVKTVRMDLMLRGNMCTVEKSLDKETEDLHSIPKSMTLAVQPGASHLIS